MSGKTGPQSRRGIGADSAAHQNRSAGAERTEPFTCRRGTAFSCRGTSGAVSLEVSRRGSTAGADSGSRVTWYTSETITQRWCRSTPYCRPRLQR